MVGPLSSEEIEDVVSSVRRLVSNEQRPRTSSRDSKVDRLILTPSLRVVSEISSPRPLMLQGAVGEALSEPVHDTVVAEAAEESGPASETIDASVDDGGSDVTETLWEDDIWLEPQDAPLAEIALGAEEAEVLDPRKDAAAMAPAPDSDGMLEPWVEVDAELVEDDSISFVPLRRRAENLAARIAAGVAKDAPVGDPGVEHSVATDPANFDEPEAENAAASVDPHPDDGPEDETARQRMPTEILDADGIPLAVLDEAALQEIVRLMIREELKGTLGERITRSVRKLVRAEINRALVARDLD
jgi:hypothetical protein